MSAVAPPSPSASHFAPPLQKLLLQVADAVQGVQAGQSLNTLLARCPSELRPGTQALTFHVLRQLGGALAARKLLAPKAPPAKVDSLLLSALALLWPVAEPAYADHTVVDQAVSAARKRVPASAGFVNAVLRRFLREREALVEATRRDPQGAFNHPPWWIDKLKADWPAQWQAILAANNEQPPMSLRAHAGRGTAEAYRERLAEAGLGAHLLGELAPQALVLDKPVPVQQLPGFAAGDVSVQDAAAQLAAPLLLNERPGLPPLPAAPRLLDACSAPGGKTAHLLELRPEAEVVALDADAERLARVQDTLNRLQQRAQLKAADARDTAAWWDGEAFDAILLDAPCSASGIVRRHPDVRWLRRAADIAQLAEIQAGLLDALWPTLKAGGRLVYATCSVFKAEGQAQVDAFLQRRPDAELIPVDGFTGHLLPLAHNEAQPGGASIVDGFFYALLLKKKA